MGGSAKGLFLDRDGVINTEKDYVHEIGEFEFIGGVFETCATFQKAGFRIVIVTNQAGIGRGYYSESDYYRLTDWMLGAFRGHGICIAGVYFCPHHPTAGVGSYRKDCRCRKPEPGMLLRASVELGIDLSSSILIGDKESDLEAGRRAKIGRLVLVRSGHPPSLTAKGMADLVIDSIADIDALNALLDT